MGTTTNMAIPYPESSDFVADGATAMENLADQVDAKSGLVFISTKTVTGGTFVEWDGDIDGTKFEHYKIIGRVDNITGSSNLNCRVMSGGTPRTTNIYLWAGWISYTGSAILNAYNGAGGTSNWRVSNSDGSGTYGNLPFEIELWSLPNASVASSYRASGYLPVTPLPYFAQIGGTMTGAQADDGVRVYLDGAVTADITASLYGYNQ